MCTKLRGYLRRLGLEKEVSKRNDTPPCKTTGRHGAIGSELALAI